MSTMFQSIHMITYSVTNFDASVQALAQHLGYQVIESGQISAILSQLWGAPAVVDCRYSVLQPSSNAEFYIRFIEAPVTPGYQPLQTFGWNGTEFLVQDVQELALSLQNSAYQIIGGPRDLLEDGTAIALQVRGPSDEIFYLTELNGEDFQAKYGIAGCAVDRAFIAVLGTQHHSPTLDFYRPLCGSITEPRRLGIRVLANAHGLDPFSTEFDIASAVLAKQYRIEIDAYPDSAIFRPVMSGHLPPGMCMVSIISESVNNSGSTLDLGTEEIHSHAYDDFLVTMLCGAAGEKIELLEAR